MTEATQSSAPEAERELVLERVIDAPRALVFQAWIKPEHLVNWFGPKGFSCETQAIDVREGGTWQFIMHGPDGTDYPNVHRYVEIVENERMVYDVGEALDGPAQFRTTVTFIDEGVRTRLRMASVFPTAEAVAFVKGFGAVELGYQTLDKLAERVDTMVFSLSRTVDAPRELVYLAWTEAERLAKWWGPKGFALEVLTLELRPGGIFHYRMSNEAGHEMYGKFVYLDVQPPERLAYISSFADPDGNTVRAPFSQDFPLEVYNLLTFSEENGKTTLSLSGGPLKATEAERAFYHGMKTSMQQGFAGTFEQLDAYLAGAQA